MSELAKRLAVLLFLGISGASVCFVVMVLWLDARTAERLGRFLERAGGALLRGVTDHLGVVIAVSTVGFFVLWSFVGFACLREWRQETRGS